MVLLQDLISDVPKKNINSQKENQIKVKTEYCENIIWRFYNKIL